MSWHWVFRIDDGFAKGATAVAAVARNPNQLDLFVAGTDGGIYSTWWDSAGGWHSFFRIDDGFAKGATSVAAVARNPDVLDIFVTGKDGRVYSSWWDSAGGWHWFFQPDDSFETGATAVTAVARNPDAIDLFVTGRDGATYSTWWRSASGWRPASFRIDDGFAKGVAALAAVARTPDGLDLFVTGTDHGIYSTWWDPGPGTLRRATITFDTHNDNKNADTIVQVFIKNRLNNSRTPQENTDFISNWLALQRYRKTGDIDDGDRNPYLAYGLFLGFLKKFDDRSSNKFDLKLVSEDISVDDVVLPQVDIHVLANGDDRWIFSYTVTLTFDAVGYSFTSAVDGVPGIILDQEYRNHSGIGTENPWRTLPIPVLTKPRTTASPSPSILNF
jgi:hypothetical protein